MVTYDDLLALDNKLKAHLRCLHFLAIEVHKSRNKLNSKFYVESISGGAFPIFF